MPVATARSRWAKRPRRRVFQVLEALQRLKPAAVELPEAVAAELRSRPELEVELPRASAHTLLQTLLRAWGEGEHWKKRLQPIERSDRSLRPAKRARSDEEPAAAASAAAAASSAAAGEDDEDVLEEEEELEEEEVCPVDELDPDWPLKERKGLARL